MGAAATSATPKHRADAVENTSRAPASARPPTSDTPIYAALVAEWLDLQATRWPPVVEPRPAPDLDPPTERLPALQFPDGWFDPLPEVRHRHPMTALFQDNPLVSAR